MSLIARLLLAASLVLVTSACYGPDPNETEEGESIPVLTLDFPDTVQPGSTHTLTLTIENAGPGDFSSLFIAFSRVGAADGVSLPEPIVDVVPKGGTSAVLDVRPEPARMAEDIRFRFDALAEGETLEVEFDLRIPQTIGVAANSVQVYDGAEPDRIKGVLLSTRVQ